jgi:hypothetical protein
LGAGAHGDIVRSLAGGKSASNQIEFMKRYGSALPEPLAEELRQEVSCDKENTSIYPTCFVSVFIVVVVRNYCILYCGTND